MRIHLLTCLILFGLSFSVQSQFLPPENLLEDIRSKYQLEKIYIHFDKDSYIAGETIWFKAYVLGGNKPSQTSSILCVELLNDSGRVLEKKVLPMINSCASSSFDLSENMKQMTATIRAYTRSMMNIGGGHLYNHRIQVLHPTEKPKSSFTEPEYGIYFFPEGGDLIAGITNVVAYKATDKWEYPVDWEAVVSDSKGAEITRFRSVHDGMGKFEFVPLPGENYYVHCTINGQEKKIVELPKVKVTGTGLRVQYINSDMFVIVNSETVFNHLHAPAYLIGVMENNMVFKINLPDESKIVRAKIPIEDLPTGILQLTVFNLADLPLAERLVFIHNNDHKIDGAFTIDTISMNKRGKNVFSHELADTLNGTFSVSVTDADKNLSTPENENIYSGLLLTSELKGYIHNPTYYFDDTIKSAQSHLDLVMLTHGWRRFSWEEIIQRRVPSVRYRDEGYINLDGTVLKDDGQTIIGNTFLSVFIRTKDGTNRFVILPVDIDGKFSLKGMIFEDTATLYFQLAEGKKLKPFIKINNLPVSGYFNLGTKDAKLPIKPWLFKEDSEKLKALYSTVLLPEFSKKAITLGEVKLTARSKSALQMVEDRYIRNPLFNSYATKTLDLVNDQNAKNTTTNIFEYLKGRLSSVTITGGGGNYFLNFRNTLSLTGGLLPMALFLNEVQTSSQQISTIPVSQVALVKVYPTGFLGAEGNSPGGALAIFTKTGNDQISIAGMDQSYRFSMEGFSPSKDFFSPDYSRIDLKETDTRTTLYWNPFLRTDQSNKRFSFSFYNSDLVKRLKIVIEGITEDGRMLHLEKFIDVK